MSPSWSDVDYEEWVDCHPGEEAEEIRRRRERRMLAGVPRERWDQTNSDFSSDGDEMETEENEGPGNGAGGSGEMEDPSLGNPQGHQLTAGATESTGISHAIAAAADGGAERAVIPAAATTEARSWDPSEPAMDGGAILPSSLFASTQLTDESEVGAGSAEASLGATAQMEAVSLTASTPLPPQSGSDLSDLEHFFGAKPQDST